MNKRFACLIWCLIMSLILVGCTFYEGPYTFFRQEQGNVKTIEICAYDSNTHTRTVVSTLSEDQELPFMADLALIHCKQYFLGDHSRAYGTFQICITYADGELELIGPYNIGYVTVYGAESLTNYYPASEQQLRDLVAKYVDVGVLALLK